ncbi:MAG: hypothetical protein CMG75_00605 [Candidatus Marinimicrobia bacterium]|nr:hypothetical protein [Candidatus Neomarinimicrobiota bacterium]|tara:strand:+ start:1976 stop:2923 length:948 start_codon:yes stop_codon:yes gene_type:complete
MLHKRILFSFLCCTVAVSFGADGKFSGVSYYHYTYNLEESAINGFGFKRVYFTYEEEVSGEISYKFQTDLDYKNSPMNVYVKNAKVDWKSSLGKITIGMQGMNIFNVQEKTWGYRFLEKSAMDHRKFSSSADMGLGFSRSLLENMKATLLVTNGTGYKKSENDSYKRTSLQLLYGESRLDKKDGFNLGGILTVEPYDQGTTAYSKTLLGGFGGLTRNRFRVGAEYNQYGDNGIGDTKHLTSAYANYSMRGDIQAFFRYDLYAVDSSEESSDYSYIMSGVVYSVGEGLVIAPNVRITTAPGEENSTIFMLSFQFGF